MPKYAVHLVTTASTTVTVEAENEEEAIERAFENAPSKAWDWPDMGDWMLPSESDPTNTGEDDVTLLEP